MNNLPILTTEPQKNRWAVAEYDLGTPSTRTALSRASLLHVRHSDGPPAATRLTATVIRPGR